MNNPARILHAIYSDWRLRLDESVATMASVVDPNTPEGARVLVQTAKALVRIDEILATYELSGRYQVQLYRRQYPEWWKGLLSYQAGWAQTMTAEHILSSAHMDEIESFANFLDGKVWELEDLGTASLRSIIADARNALKIDDQLSQELRLYIHRLLQQVEVAMDDDAVGAAFDYEDAVMRLFVAFKAAEGEQTAATGAWGNLRTSILPAGGVATVIEGMSIFAQKMLGM